MSKMGRKVLDEQLRGQGRCEACGQKAVCDRCGGEEHTKKYSEDPTPLLTGVILAGMRHLQMLGANEPLPESVWDSLRYMDIDWSYWLEKSIVESNKGGK